MANYISDDKWDLAVNLFDEGKSHREVAKIVGIAKYTAYKIYRSLFDAAKESGTPPPKKRKGGHWDHKNMTDSPCKSGRTPDEIFCPHMDEDKNSERCVECQPRIEYAVAMGMLPEEVLEQKEDPVVKEAWETVAPKKSYSKPEIVKVDKKTKIIDLEKKESRVATPKKKQKYEDRHIAHLAFPEKYDEVYHELVKIAEIEDRKTGIQAIHWIKQGIESWKGEHKSG